MAQPQRNSVQWVVLRLLAYLGVTNLLSAAPPAADPDATSQTFVTPGLLDDMAGILSAALQDIALDGPAHLSEYPLGGTLMPPATISLAVLPGNAASQLVAGFLPWMVGCTVAIAGDPFLNEFVNGTGRLRRPYGGTATGTVTATVYGNAILLPIDVKNVLKPVIVGGRGEMVPCTTREQFDRVSGAAWHNPCHMLRQGLPEFYFVETAFDEMLAYLPTTIRFAPCPVSSLPATFRAKLNPPTVSTDDIGDDDIDPAVMLPGVAGAYTEAIFLPYCLQLLTGHPLWKPDNPNAAAEISRRYAAAKQKLQTQFRAQAGGSAVGYAYSGRK